MTIFIYFYILLRFIEFISNLILLVSPPKIKTNNQKQQENLRNRVKDLIIEKEKLETDINTLRNNKAGLKRELEYKEADLRQIRDEV